MHAKRRGAMQESNHNAGSLHSFLLLSPAAPLEYPYEIFTGAPDPAYLLSQIKIGSDACAIPRPI